MNKIKTIYDVVRKMKDKDSIKGTVKVKGMKNEEMTFDLSSTFEKNDQGCQVKGKTVVNLDQDGKKIKLESNIDFQKDGSCGHHDHTTHMHPFHNHHGIHGGGLKVGLNRISTVLGVLSSIKLDEKETGTVVLSLESADIPQEVKNNICEMMKKGREHHMHMDGVHHQHMHMKEFHEMENAEFTIIAVINNNSEIEKITIEVDGEQKDEKNGTNTMKLAAELCLE